MDFITARDYLNSYLLYAMIIGAILGIIIYRPEIKLDAVTSFNVNGQLLFPILFVTVACGAIIWFSRISRLWYINPNS